MIKVDQIPRQPIESFFYHSVSVGGMLADLTQAPVSVGGKLEMMRVRATDPRPCHKCGKIYRSAHTLRTHMEDKHTICPGYRCVLCGTVAKSRNSLHSHMSRQHRGISTKARAAKKEIFWHPKISAYFVNFSTAIVNDNLLV